MGEKKITVDMLDAIKVQFLKPIFEDDFPARGMKAWLVRIEWCERTDDMWKLYFDFTDFESENEKYFTRTFHRNCIAQSKYPNDAPDTLYTAIDAGCYSRKYDVYFDYIGCENDTPEVRVEKFTEEIAKYLKVID
jgi:hypothetical protein